MKIRKLRIVSIILFLRQFCYTCDSCMTCICETQPKIPKFCCIKLLLIFTNLISDCPNIITLNIFLMIELYPFLRFPFIVYYNPPPLVIIIVESKDTARAKYLGSQNLRDTIRCILVHMNLYT